MEDIFSRIRQLETKQKIILFVIILVVFIIITRLIHFVLNSTVLDLIIYGIVGYFGHKIFIKK